MSSSAKQHEQRAGEEVLPPRVVSFTRHRAWWWPGRGDETRLTHFCPALPVSKARWIMRLADQGIGYRVCSVGKLQVSRPPVHHTVLHRQGLVTRIGISRAPRAAHLALADAPDPDKIGNGRQACCAVPLSLMRGERAGAPLNQMMQAAATLELNWPMPALNSRSLGWQKADSKCPSLLSVFFIQRGLETAM